ncbi:MAG TPA: STAS domain-containing protein [Nocardioidaceae bacterium]|nr:STAS domain-containing protein [Nocardioidaceae bacterium]
MSLIDPSSAPTPRLGGDTLTPPRGDHPAMDAPDGLTVDVERVGVHSVVTVAGELDVATAPMLNGVLRDVLDVAAPCVVMDLDRVSFIDSTGLGVLVAAHRRAAGVAGKLVLVCHDPRCLKVIEITGLTRIFTFAPTVEAATDAGAEA